MAKTKPFDLYSQEYDKWFDEHQELYRLEIKALRTLADTISSSRGLEIGVGSGMFAVPLKVKIGVDPSFIMAKRAKAKNIEVACGVAEALPIQSESVDYCLMVTTICFVDDPVASFKEAYRILKPGGGMIVGFVDRDSPLGKAYQSRKDKSKFYGEATFFSCEEVADLLEAAGFVIGRVVQTIIEEHGRLANKIMDGCGLGSFVAIYGIKGHIR